MITYKDFFIGRIYTIVKKTEIDEFYFDNKSREWDGFTLLTEGEGVFIDEYGNTKVYSVGDIALLGRGRPYKIHLPNGGAYITSALDIHFEGLDDNNLFSQLLHLDDDTVKRFEEIYERFSSCEEKAIIETRMLLTSIYAEIMQNIEPPTGTANKDAKKAERIVRQTFRENLSVPEIARRCSISPSYLRACFLQSFGTSITRYREHLRIEEAEILIRCGFFSIREIAEQLGYCDVFHFTKNFTRAKGISPSKYREQFSNK